LLSRFWGRPIFWKIREHAEGGGYLVGRYGPPVHAGREPVEEGLDVRGGKVLLLGLRGGGD
jgi:hypothetical protein